MAAEWDFDALKVYRDEETAPFFDDSRIKVLSSILKLSCTQWRARHSKLDVY